MCGLVRWTIVSYTDPNVATRDRPRTEVPVEQEWGVTVHRAEYVVIESRE